MKKIGIIGGMSWESTIEYYRIINEEIQKIFGGIKSAEILIESYDFDEIAKLQRNNDWDKLASILANSAKKMEVAGADLILIATNTMHKIASYVQDSIDIPLVHIIDSTSCEIINKGYKKVGLIGTKYTMSQNFYKKRMEDKYLIECIVPEDLEQDIIHDIIFDELCAGKILENSRNKICKIIDSLKAKGAEAVVLGCTELPNIIKHASIPIIDTMEIHARHAVKMSLDETISLFL